MTEYASSEDRPNTGWRLKAGIALLLISIILPIMGIPLVAGLDLSGAIAASLSGAMLIGAELLGVAAIAVMGKPGYQYIKSWVFGFLKQYGPPKEVSRTRYYIGLVMFCVPLVFGWMSPYATDLIPGFMENPTPYAVAGDMMLLASLFVLGGDFWDKIRALFVWSDKVAS
jgi:membrane protease YdiL (CAAX protease family)